jgi:hypothetical protein
MKQRLLPVFILLSAIASPAAALEWPVQDVKPLHLFGQRTGKVIQRGIVTANQGPVRAAADGTLLLILEENSNMSGFPGTLGNAVCLVHDDNLSTVYGNLSTVDRVSDRTVFETGSILSDGNRSGWGPSLSCTFLVLDLLKKKVLNPLMLLPVLKDTRGPVIKNVVAVSSANDQGIALGTTKQLKQGKWRIYADITDTIDGFEPEFSAFRVGVLVNGTETATLPIEILEEKNGTLYMQTPVFSDRKLYEDSAGMYLGEVTLTRGRADISVIARDLAGNERSVLFGVQIE